MHYIFLHPTDNNQTFSLKSQSVWLKYWMSWGRKMKVHGYSGLYMWQISLKQDFWDTHKTIASSQQQNPKNKDSRPAKWADQRVRLCVLQTWQLKFDPPEPTWWKKRTEAVFWVPHRSQNIIYTLKKEKKANEKTKPKKKNPKKPKWQSLSKLSSKALSFKKILICSTIS